MNLVATAPTWLLGVLCVFLLAAVVEDFVRLKISNAITILVLGSALVAVAIHGWSIDLWQNLAIFVALMVAGTFLFATGKMGGGDVKLLAAVGLWVDFDNALILLPAVFITGGALAIIVLSKRMLLRPANGVGQLSRSRGVPYGIAIAIGMMVLIALQLQSRESRYQQFTKLTYPVGAPGR